jgi:hypothetical protein
VPYAGGRQSISQIRQNDHAWLKALSQKGRSMSIDNVVPITGRSIVKPVIPLEVIKKVAVSGPHGWLGWWHVHRLARALFDQENPKHVAEQQVKIDNKHRAHTKWFLTRQRRNLRALNVYEVNTSANIKSVNPAYIRIMICLGWLAIAGGLGILNNIIAAYLISSGRLIYYTEHPLAAYFFVALPLIAVLVLKVVSMHLNERARRVYVLSLALFGFGALIVWISAFAWLFSPVNATGLTTLPEDGGDGDKAIVFALIVAHLTGEILFAAVLGLWVERLALGNRVREVGQNPEFAFTLAGIAGTITDLLSVGIRYGAKRDFLSQRKAARKAFVIEVIVEWRYQRATIKLARASGALNYVEVAGDAYSQNLKQPR